MKKISISTINQKIEEGASEFVSECSKRYANKLEETAQTIYEKKEEKPVLLISGPSGSGKTTTAIKLDELLDNPSLPPADRTARVIQMACKHAVKGGERLPEASVSQLIRDVIEQKVTPTCPHGRPLMVQLTRAELDKRFRRIQS